MSRVYSINIRNKKVLVDIFYRPLNSHPQVWSHTENSIGMATDTGITDIVNISEVSSSAVAQ